MQFSRFFTALTYHGPPEASSCCFPFVDEQNFRESALWGHPKPLHSTGLHGCGINVAWLKGSYLPWNQLRPWKSASDEFPFGVFFFFGPIFRCDMLPCFRGVFGAGTCRTPRFKFSILEGGKCVRREDRPPRKTMAFLSCLAKGSNFTIVTFVQWYFPRWFQFFLYFYPEPWGNDPIWRSCIFQMGWFNHQLVSPAISWFLNQTSSTSSEQWIKQKPWA